MNTLTYNSQSQLIVTSNPDNQILQSASYKAGMEDIKKGNVTSYSSSDEMFRDLLAHQ